MECHHLQRSERRSECRVPLAILLAHCYQNYVKERGHELRKKRRHEGKRTTRLQIHVIAIGKEGIVDFHLPPIVPFTGQNERLSLWMLRKREEYDAPLLDLTRDDEMTALWKEQERVVNHDSLFI